MPKTFPSRVQEVDGVTNAGTPSESNFEVLAKITRDDTVNAGPPTSLEWLEGEWWVDKYRAVWLCTVAGTPGTWIQFRPAVLAAWPSAPPTNYWVVRSDQWFMPFRWNGSAWVSAIKLYNADQAKWHTITIVGAAGAEQIVIGAGETLT